MSMYDTEPEYCDPGRLRRSRPTLYRCLKCGWKGHGTIARAEHREATRHQPIVSQADPRCIEADAARKVG